MNLSDTLTRLAQGELSNLSMADGGAIKPSEVPKVVGYINEALLRLHSRFVLRHKDLIIQMHEAITMYELKPQFALSYEGNIVVPHKYIIDIGNKKFLDDVIRIVTAFNPVGMEHELNNHLAPFGIFTPKPKTIQIPVPIHGETISVVYQAKHPLLGSDEDELEDEIELPDVLLGALTAYVGFQAFNFIGGPENISRASNYMALYNEICMEMEQKDSMGSNTTKYLEKFEMRGFS